MLIMLEARFPVDCANELAASGKLGKTIQAILDEQKPESVYFLDRDGDRTAILVVDVKNAAGLPALAEPWMQALEASIEMHPVMTAADLAKAEPDIKRIAKRFG
ncbi:MAG: hypothetical protein ACI8TX_002098 [Hyphomicrobiaceae bacterium]|jgi:hypothetical protein